MDILSGSLNSGWPYVASHSKIMRRKESPKHTYWCGTACVSSNHAKRGGGNNHKYVGACGFSLENQINHGDFFYFLFFIFIFYSCGFAN